MTLLNRQCWCGQDRFIAFSPLYEKCEACGSLVLSHIPTKDVTHITDDENDLYGRNYYLKRLVEQYGFPPIETRARRELSERCLHWLKTLLRYKLPPAKVLELGSSHGGFVAMMRWAGYDATGLELSPWLVDFAKATFGVPMLTGPIEDQDIAEGSLDVIVLMDVLEHLPDPLNTLRKCLGLLKPEGIMLIQTPCCPEGASYEQMLAEHNPFLEQLKYEEHIYLFTSRSVQTFFERLNVGNINFERAIFDHYDMFFAAGRSPLNVQTPDAIEAVLSAGRESRLVQAMLDMDDARKLQAETLGVCEGDRVARLEVINNLEAQLAESESDRAARLAVIGQQAENLEALAQRVEELSGQVEEYEALRARVDIINRHRQPATIAVDVTPILPDGTGGGVKQLVLELLKGFGERAGGDKFILLTSWRNDNLFQEYDKYGMKRFCVVKEPLDRKDPVWKLGKDFLRKVSGVYARRGILKKNGVSVLFCPLTAPTFFESGIPTVSIICDLQHLYYPSFFDKGEYSYRQHFYAQLKRKVDYAVCISEYTRKTVIDKLALPEQNVFSVPISVQTRLALPSPDYAGAILEKHNLTGKKYCIYPANLWPHKNHRMLLVAFRMYLSRYPESDLHLVLTGATIKGDFADVPARMKMDDRVHFLAYLDEPELSVIWDSSHFLVFPSLFEGFGIPLVEAMMYGKPILASNATSIPEVAGDAALYFDPRRPDELAGAMHSLVSNGELYSALAAKGRRRLRRFNFTAMVDQYLDLLHMAVAGGEAGLRTDVTGLYEDGWASDRIRVTHQQSGHGKILRLKGSVPGWHPRASLKITTSGDGLKRRTVVVKRNEVFTLEEVLPAGGGGLDIKVSGGFVPKNGDTRKLAFRVEGASITEETTGRRLYVHEDGK